MKNYAIGDIQGCFEQLHCLLEKLNFNPNDDCLWLVGDLINRGPASLDVLRFVKQLPNTQIVLGNHDLHFISVASGVGNANDGDTFEEILNAPDCLELADWLRQQKLFLFDKNASIAMVHAGVPPIWDLQDTMRLAQEVETMLHGESYKTFLSHMYGNKPNQWDETLTDSQRLRTITNYLTRMRYCQANGKLDLKYKGPIGGQAEGYQPWFSWPQKFPTDVTLLFGHWAALNGECPNANYFALDTGCVWGNRLTAIDLQSFQKQSV